MNESRQELGNSAELEHGDATAGVGAELPGTAKQEAGREGCWSETELGDTPTSFRQDDAGSI